MSFINLPSQKTPGSIQTPTISSSPRTKFVVIAIFAILFFFVLCFRTVGAGEVGIITRFGDVDRTAQPGIALKLPWPIERLVKMETRVQKEEQESAAATADLQDVKATLAVNYALDSETAINVYKTIGPEYKERIIIPAVQESFKAASADYTANQLVTERTAVKNAAYEVIKSRLGKFGIRVVDVNIVNFSFSPEFNSAIEQVQVANQQVAQAKQQLEKARVDAETKIAQAQADAEAQRLQQQTLTPELLQKYAIDKWNGVLPTTQAGDGTIFSIPTR
jgi:regulator of protease activity HflC (stomatin/prohibitin superfamily)